jgi:hypothetical protein
VPPGAVPARLVEADAPGLLGPPTALLGSAALLLYRLAMACRRVAFPGALGRSRGEAELPVVHAQCEGQEQCRPVVSWAMRIGVPAVMGELLFREYGLQELNNSIVRVPCPPT